MSSMQIKTCLITARDGAKELVHMLWCPQCNNAGAVTEPAKLEGRERIECPCGAVLTFPADQVNSPDQAGQPLFS